MPEINWIRVVVALTQAAVLTLVLACSEAPMDYSKKPSTAFADTEDTYFGRILAEEAPIMPIFHNSTRLLVKPWVTRFPTTGLREWFFKDVIIRPHQRH